MPRTPTGRSRAHIRRTPGRALTGSGHWPAFPVAPRSRVRSLLAALAQASVPAHGDGVSGERGPGVDEGVQHLVVAGHRHVEPLPDRGLLRTVPVARMEF